MLSARVSAIVAGAAGLVLVASSAAHAFLGWPAVRQALASAGAGADLIQTMAVGWGFGSVSMLAFGLIVLGVARVGRHGRMSRGPLLVIGLAYLAFGLAAFLMTGLNPHFVLFMATGVLVLIPAFGPGSPG